jgi:hypothetical protein
MVEFGSHGAQELASYNQSTSDRSINHTAQPPTQVGSQASSHNVPCPSVPSSMAALGTGRRGRTRDFQRRNTLESSAESRRTSETLRTWFATIAIVRSAPKHREASYHCWSPNARTVLVSQSNSSNKVVEQAKRTLCRSQSRACWIDW